MTRGQYVTFVADVRRLRGLVVVILALVSLAPSVIDMWRQDLSPLSVLVRLVLALVVLGVLTWAISALVLHYARVQLLASERADESGEA